MHASGKAEILLYSLKNPKLPTSAVEKCTVVEKHYVLILEHQQRKMQHVKTILGKIPSMGAFHLLHHGNLL